MALPAQYERLEPQQAPSEPFCLEQLDFTPLPLYRGQKVALLALQEPSREAAIAVIKLLVAGEKQRAGCELLRTNDVRRTEKLAVNVVVRCSHGRCRERSRSHAGTAGEAASESDTGAASCTEPTSAQATPSKRARHKTAALASDASAAARSDRAARRDGAAEQGGGARGSCKFGFRAKQWLQSLQYLVVLLMFETHVDEGGVCVHACWLTDACRNTIRDGCAQNMSAQAIVNGAPCALVVQSAVHAVCSSRHNGA